MQPWRDQGFVQLSCHCLQGGVLSTQTYIKTLLRINTSQSLEPETACCQTRLVDPLSSWGRCCGFLRWPSEKEALLFDLKALGATVAGAGVQPPRSFCKVLWCEDLTVGRAVAGAVFSTAEPQEMPLPGCRKTCNGST